MKKAVIAMAVVLLMICLSVWALGWEHETTGHLIVSFRDMETGGPITNVTVTVKTLNCIGPNAGVYESHYTRTSAMTDSNGVADVEFRFLVPDFDWSISRPSGYYTNGFGIESECFGAEFEPSDYEDIDETTPGGAAKAQQIRALHESGNWLSLWRLFGPKNVTYTNTTIRRSVSFYPKHNPLPMYVYSRFNKDSISLPLGTTVATNGVEIREYPDVDVDLMKCGLLPPYGGESTCGEVSDFKLVRNSVVTNGIRRFSGYVEFAPGCGAYIRKKRNDASFNTAYAADTNAVYLSRIPFSSEKDLASNKILSVSLILNPDEYMVLRTRATYDAVGNPTNWCYSKVEGKIVVNRRLWFERIVFNPRPNDPNLEVGENLARHR